MYVNGRTDNLKKKTKKEKEINRKINLILVPKHIIVKRELKSFFFILINYYIRIPVMILV